MPLPNETHFIDDPTTVGGRPLWVLKGAPLEGVLEEAVVMSTVLDRPIHFVFCGVEFIVEKDSDVVALYQAWHAGRYGWNTRPMNLGPIGPCRKPPEEKKPAVWPTRRTLIL